MAVIMDNCMKIVTYNLHGFNNGRSCFVDLCNDPSVGIIALQEHWLSPDRLHLLNEVHPDFSGCCISPMSYKWVNEIFRDRPYGGVGFLWRTKFSGTSISFKACSGRIIALLLELDSGSILNIVSVYFPCYVKSCEYKAALAECLSDIKRFCQTVMM